jgi:release factor glutamine methyltransferase
MESLAALVDQAAERLVREGFAPTDARVDAGVLARAVLGWDVTTWLARQQEPAPPTAPAWLEAAVARRARREPVAYITGEREFYGRSFRVTRDVLIPRPETEFVVDAALACLAARPGATPRIIDIGTGSGCIAVTIACEAPSVRLTASDVAPEAIAIARENATRHGVVDRIDFVEGSLFAGRTDPEGGWDLAVSNPPYVARRDRDTLAPDVRDFEPDQALFGGDDGLEVIRALARAAGTALASGGSLVMEIGAGQLDAVRAVIDQTRGLVWARTLLDLQQIPRVVVAQAGRADPSRRLELGNDRR